MFELMRCDSYGCDVLYSSTSFEDVSEVSDEYEDEAAEFVVVATDEEGVYA
jgi:hypothetical protein